MGQKHHWSSYIILIAIAAIIAALVWLAIAL
jgi:hypothetical protein